MNVFTSQPMDLLLKLRLLKSPVNILPVVQLLNDFGSGSILSEFQCQSKFWH